MSNPVLTIHSSSTKKTNTKGAFKADLFRYCVLLIRGGVYADMDVLLETNLDDAIANDIGFMTPIDEVR